MQEENRWLSRLEIASTQRSPGAAGARARQPLRPGRHGVIVRVLRGDPNPRYEIRWDEGVTTVFSPTGGALHADPNYDAGATDAGAA